ncbi:ATP-dependent RecD-like DNA helicase [termite gut metagenome]|uniref:ATP-dependent RecD-like DNA helicase n=1 Tax=termite gut metagenome TaxID=433724 RepID=A0A5J4T1Y9_9ZZZZ
MNLNMTLRETFSSYTLTSEQSALLNELELFLNDKSSLCFLLKGYAGTGKTFMMKGLTDFFKHTDRPFILAAPTGRAAKVISKRTKSKAYTIHKTIYSNQDLQEYKTTDLDGSETFKFYYNLKNNEDGANAVYIIDEASMVSDTYSEGEFFRFGSGFLLTDFLKYINFDNNDHNKKLIFIGDNAQLPPVNMNFSPALSEQYLVNKYSVNVRNFELTEVVRQQKDSGILQNATKIRDAIKDKIFNQINIKTDTADTKHIEHADLLTTYLQACNNQIDDDTILLAHSNSSVKEYNDFVRKHFFPNQIDITTNDRLILVHNNYNYEIELLNGDFGKVVDVSPQNETHTIMLKKKLNNGDVREINVHLTFRDIIVEFTDIEDRKFQIPCKIVENLLYSKERDLSSNELKALYIDFKIRNPNLKPGTKELKDTLRTDKYFNALRVKFGYAVTCHKAQGGEWKQVFINCKTSMGYFNASYYRWLYTALTRAKETLYLLDEPHFGIGSAIHPPKNENFIPRNDLIVLNPELLEIDLPFNLSSEPEHFKNIFYVVSDLIKDEEVEIKTIKHNQYCEDYTFSKANEDILFKIYYNAKYQISNIQKPVSASEWVNLLNETLKTIEKKTIILDSAPDIQVQKEFEFLEPFLQDFFNHVHSIVQDEGIVIEDIIHNQWLQKYVFRQGSFVAEIDFYYNGKKQFSRIVPQVPKSTSIELLNKIVALININK